MRSFTDSDTEFELIRSDTPIDVDGFKIGEPTGEIKCLECGSQHDNIDEIPHDPDCSQRWVKSAWWADHLRP